MCTKLAMPSFVLFIVLASALITGSYSDQVLRNVNIFDSGAVFRETDDASKEVIRKSVPRILEEENTFVSTGDSLSVLVRCRDLQLNLGRSVADFTQCAIMNARPITMCCQCATPLNKTLEAHQMLMEAAENATKCKDVLFSKDKLEIVETMHDSVLNLWNRGNCYSCYEVKKNGDPDLSVVSNQTLNFFQVLNQVTECFERIKFVNGEMNDTPNDTCSECKELYEHLGAMFDAIVNEVTAGQPVEMCADITDAMNVTHHLWNNQFKCKLFGKDVGYSTFVLTGSLSALPVLFYLAAKILSSTEPIHLVLPKRKQFVQDREQLQM